MNLQKQFSLRNNQIFNKKGRPAKTAERPFFIAEINIPCATYNGEPKADVRGDLQVLLRNRAAHNL